MPKHRLRAKENYIAKLIAAVVRNNIEDFHCKYLSDAQMEELNPLIRNAIYTGLFYLLEDSDALVQHYSQYIPPYWEDCELLPLNSRDAKMYRCQKPNSHTLLARSFMAKK
ncbi:MAG: hypothetical protein LBN95_01580 [Prevotellaceae bacterium]|jgi:hypothetical protein|nr:hypothetical protein [Prevotellaceae bacterium]